MVGCTPYFSIAPPTNLTWTFAVSKPCGANATLQHVPRRFFKKKIFKKFFSSFIDFKIPKKSHFLTYQEGMYLGVKNRRGPTLPNSQSSVGRIENHLIFKFCKAWFDAATWQKQWFAHTQLEAKLNLEKDLETKSFVWIHILTFCNLTFKSQVCWLESTICNPCESPTTHVSARQHFGVNIDVMQINDKSRPKERALNLVYNTVVCPPVVTDRQLKQLQADGKDLGAWMNACPKFLWDANLRLPGMTPTTSLMLHKVWTSLGFCKHKNCTHSQWATVG